MRVSRRALLKASAASAVLGGIGAPLVARAQTAEFTYKFANNLPDSHPLNARAKEMAAAIKTETNGRFDLQIFPNNQLGSDTDMLSQIRSGGIEFFRSECPRQGDGGGDQDRDQWALRPADFPEQPARFRHRYAEPDPIRRHRILQIGMPAPRRWRRRSRPRPMGASTCRFSRTTSSVPTPIC